jgi:hypothetical protein
MSAGNTVNGDCMTPITANITKCCTHSRAVKVGSIHPVSGSLRDVIPSVQIRRLVKIEGATPRSAR